VSSVLAPRALGVAGDWSDEDEFELPRPRPLDRADQKIAEPGPVKKLVDIAIKEDLVVEALDALLGAAARRFRFSPEVVSSGEGHTSIWLPELNVFGEGEDFDGAASDLVSEVRVYLEEWHADLRFAANHSAREGYVRRLELDPSSEGIYRAIFGG
jgi:hypothetical protein